MRVLDPRKGGGYYTTVGTMTFFACLCYLYKLMKIHASFVITLYLKSCMNWMSNKNKNQDGCSINFKNGNKSYSRSQLDL